MIYNSSKLHNQLAAAGLAVASVDSNGQIAWQPEHPTQGEEDQAAYILAAHDPFEYNLFSSAQRIAGNGLDTAIVSVHAPSREAPSRGNGNSGVFAKLLINNVPVDVPIIDDAGITYVISDSPGSVIEVTGADGELANFHLVIYVI